MWKSEFYYSLSIEEKLGRIVAMEMTRGAILRLLQELEQWMELEDCPPVCGGAKGF